VSAARSGRPAAVLALMALLLLQGISGVAGGVSLVTAPDGRIMQMPVSNLDGSPFSDYLIPGAILLLVLGVFPLVVLVGLWLCPRPAWYGAFPVGCGLIIWIIVEVFIIPLSTLQAFFGVVGVLMPW
jgi:hypothetical protein